jgi:stage II sporulation protein AA (anti-sigma F factor antagonist)
MGELDFDLAVTRDADGASRLTLRGELDLGSAGRLEQALAEADGEVLLDLRGLTFMDSTGVRVLLETAERSGTLLRILPPESGEARVTIEETGIGPLLPLVREERS